MATAVGEAAWPGRSGARPAAAWAAVAIGAIALLAIACRATAMGSRLHIDESFSWYVSSAPSAHLFLHRLAETENTPPLFYLLLSAVPGSSPSWLRVPAVVPGVLMCVVVWRLARRRLGEPAALIGALGTAVAPFLVTDSDLARAFMLADLALLCALWALLALVDAETPWRWAAFVLAGAVAVWTEFDAAIVLVAMALAAAVGGYVRRPRVVLALAVSLVSIAPWISQIVRAQDQLGHTKLNPMNAGVSFGALRDLIVTLTFGENGGVASHAGRWALAAVVVAVLLGAAGVLVRGWGAPAEPPQWWAAAQPVGGRPRHLRGRASQPQVARTTLVLLAATALLTVIGHALVVIVGVHVFSQRYMTILVPLLALVVGAALDALRWRWAVAVVAAGLCVLGIGNAWHRRNAEFEPSFAPVRAAIEAAHPATILTNTPTVLYEFRGSRPRPIMDRPYNLGPGRQAMCADPCVVVDDSRVPGGTPRPQIGPTRPVGPFVVTVRP